MNEKIKNHWKSKSECQCCGETLPKSDLLMVRACFIPPRHRSVQMTPKTLISQTCERCARSVMDILEPVETPVPRFMETPEPSDVMTVSFTRARGQLSMMVSPATRRAMDFANYLNESAKAFFLTEDDG